MDEDLNAKARDRGGLILDADLGTHPGRSARRRGLTAVHPHAYVAGTQPVDVSLALGALREVRTEQTWAVMSEAALWLYGLAPVPEVLEVGIPLQHKMVVVPPAEVRRVADSVLRGRRPLKGCHVVALEVAIIQVARTWSPQRVVELVEAAVRGRQTTLARLRARCRRGMAGSAKVRAVCNELAGGSMDLDVRRLKAALEALGVTGLEVEVHFTSAAGASAYADLLHRPTMTVIEVDGYLTHSRREQFRTDRRRDRWMGREHQALTLRVDVGEIREDVQALARELAGSLLPASDVA